ncbi:hypothetical protein, partial [Vibrio cyclitrophicus]|uniref:hypothetical protein n=1 Tax=Vibrio cyclitrophicus TaxID=47951 RepID=UPI0018E4AC6A
MKIKTKLTIETQGNEKKFALALVISTQILANGFPANDYEWKLNVTEDWAYIKADNGLTMVEDFEQKANAELDELD